MIDYPLLRKKFHVLNSRKKYKRRQHAKHWRIHPQTFGWERKNKNAMIKNDKKKRKRLKKCNKAIFWKENKMRKKWVFFICMKLRVFSGQRGQQRQHCSVSNCGQHTWVRVSSLISLLINSQTSVFNFNSTHCWGFAIFFRFRLNFNFVFFRLFHSVGKTFLSRVFCQHTSAQQSAVCGQVGIITPLFFSSFRVIISGGEKVSTNLSYMILNPLTRNWDEKENGARVRELSFVMIWNASMPRRAVLCMKLSRLDLPEVRE